MMSFDMMSFGYDVIGSTKCIAMNLLIVGIGFFILGYYLLKKYFWVYHIMYSVLLFIGISENLYAMA